MGHQIAYSRYMFLPTIRGVKRTAVGMPIQFCGAPSTFVYLPQPQWLKTSNYEPCQEMEDAFCLQYHAQKHLASISFNLVSTSLYQKYLPCKTQSLSGWDLSPWMHAAGHLWKKYTTLWNDLPESMTVYGYIQYKILNLRTKTS